MTFLLTSSRAAAIQPFPWNKFSSAAFRQIAVERTLKALGKSITYFQDLTNHCTVCCRRAHDIVVI
jgi:hypothetical protein